VLDEAVLLRLNQEYLQAYMTADVEWYARRLTESFTCRSADGTVLDKAGFLRKIAGGPDVLEYHLLRARVRFNGDTAAVDGTGSYRLPDGREGSSRYTDTYQLIGGEWKVSSAEIERIAAQPRALSGSLRP